MHIRFWNPWSLILCWMTTIQLLESKQLQLPFVSKVMLMTVCFKVHEAGKYKKIKTSIFFSLAFSIPQNWSQIIFPVKFSLTALQAHFMSTNLNFCASPNGHIFLSLPHIQIPLSFICTSISPSSMTIFLSRHLTVVFL